MFIEWIKVKNFGRIKSAEQSYIDGLIVVRGGNGSGKTTITVQCPLYCLFGSSTLDSPLADTVHEDAKPSGMSVEMKYGPYITFRSKASASVVGNGVSISGQAEVTDFWYDHFGLAKGTEEAVLLAKQGETAGILTGKSGEITTVIEDLAGFYQIDSIIEKVKVQFPSGNKALLEENLEAQKLKLEGFKEVVLPDTRVLATDLMTANKALESAVEAILAPKAYIASHELLLKAANELNTSIAECDTNISNKLATIAEHNAELKTLTEKEYKEFDLAGLGKAKALIENLVSVTADRKAYDWVKSLVPSEIVWEGDVTNFLAEFDIYKATVEKLKLQVSEAKLHIKHLSSEKPDSDVCGECGTDISKKNAEVQAIKAAKLAEHEKVLAELEPELAEAEETLEVLRAINTLHERCETNCPDHTSVTVGKSVVPHTYYWGGLEPVKPDQEAINAANALLKDFDAEQLAMKNDDSRVKKLAELTISAKDTLAEWLIKLQELGAKKDISELEAQIAAKKEELEALEEKEKAQRQVVADKKEALVVAEKDIKNHNEKVADTTAEAAATRKKIKVDGRNGKLIKSVRDGRLKVIDLVWSNVVTMVTHKCSEMLGREMVVEKGPKGFRVNGRHVGRLSGAEKSSTGIALRESIRDTFASNAGFVFLDEPCSDMDVDVTAATISAIASMRGQVFVITHENELEIFADQVVELNRGS